MQSLIVKMGFHSDRYVGNALFRMYASCGAVGLARQVFDEMPVRDVVSWSSLIAGYVAWYEVSNFCGFVSCLARNRDALIECIL